MTKLLFCELCRVIVPTAHTIRHPTYCQCKRFASWWENPVAGIFSVCDNEQMPLMVKRAKQMGTHIMYPPVPRCYVLGLHNGLLTMDGSSSKEKIENILTFTPPNYLFKTQNTLIIKIRPGESGDTMYAPLPNSDLEKQWLADRVEREKQRQETAEKDADD